MDFLTAAKYMKLGYRIRRESWKDGYVEGYELVAKDRSGYCWHIDRDDVLADDWDIVRDNLYDLGKVPTYDDYADDKESE